MLQRSNRSKGADTSICEPHECQEFLGKVGGERACQQVFKWSRDNRVTAEVAKRVQALREAVRWALCCNLLLLVAAAHWCRMLVLAVLSTHAALAPCFADRGCWRQVHVCALRPDPDKGVVFWLVSAWCRCCQHSAVHCRQGRQDRDRIGAGCTQCCVLSHMLCSFLVSCACLPCRPTMVLADTLTSMRSAGAYPAIKGLSTIDTVTMLLDKDFW